MSGAENSTLKLNLFESSESILKPVTEKSEQETVCAINRLEKPSVEHRVKKKDFVFIMLFFEIKNREILGFPFTIC